MMDRRRWVVGLWSVMVLSILAGHSLAGAHFVWVEADATAPSETGQPLKVYFGEYSPVSEEVYQDFFLSVKRGLVVEQDQQAQLYRLLRMYVDVPRGIEQLAKSGANPITPGEVVERLKQISLALQRERQQEPSGV